MVEKNGRGNNWEEKSGKYMNEKSEFLKCWLIKKVMIQ